MFHFPISNTRTFKEQMFNIWGTNEPVSINSSYKHFISSTFFSKLSKQVCSYVAPGM